MMEFITKLIPAPYRWLIGIVAIVGVLGTVSYVSYHKGLAQADIQIAEYKNKKADLAKDLGDKNLAINDRVVIKYVDRVKVVHDTQIVYRDVIKNVVPTQVQLSKGWVYTHNQIALGLPIDPVLAADPTPSGIYDTLALSTISDNYSSCAVDRAQLEALQQGISEWNKAVEEAKKNK